jgi:hypothetical protein
MHGTMKQIGENMGGVSQISTLDVEDLVVVCPRSRTVENFSPSRWDWWQLLATGLAVWILSPSI